MMKRLGLGSRGGEGDGDGGPGPVGHHVDPPVLTVADAMLKHLEEAGSGAEPATHWKAMSEVFRDGGCTRLYNDLRSLQVAVEQYEAKGGLSFWDALLPFVCNQALRFNDLFPETIAIVDETVNGEGGVSRIVEWDQAQCLCIQCNALLCAWPNRTSSNCHCVESYRGKQADVPSINLDEMLCGAGNHVPQVAKCEMFLHYLAKQKERVEVGDPLNRKISFVRRMIEPPGADASTQFATSGIRPEPVWVESTKPLGAVEVRPLRESIDAAKDMLRADFANESIGGGSIAYGCVQEEIMFACHPELNCARLIFTPMRENEAFVLVGAEQFAEPRGYAFNLECGGPCRDQTPLQPGPGSTPAEEAVGGAGAAAAEAEEMPVDGDAQGRFGGGQLAAYVTAIDAMDYRGARDLSVQFQPEYVKRELLKAFAGFALPPEVVGSRPPGTLATGNWGAGAFMGDGRLKALIQWAAASEAGLSMCYFPFDDSYLAEELQPVAEAATAKGITVGQLCVWLFKLPELGANTRNFNALEAFRQWVVTI